MSYRSPARWLAPLALVGAAIAIVITISATGGSDGGESSSGTRGNTGGASQGTTATTTARARTGPGTYTVQPGDVLSGIAVKTGVPLEEIERLNPDVDAQTLRTGQKLKLTP